MNLLECFAMSASNLIEVQSMKNKRHIVSFHVSPSHDSGYTQCSRNVQRNIGLLFTSDCTINRHEPVGPLRIPSNTVTRFIHFISLYRTVLMSSCLVTPGDSHVPGGQGLGEKGRTAVSPFLSCSSSTASFPANLPVP